MPHGDVGSNEMGIWISLGPEAMRRLAHASTLSGIPVHQVVEDFILRGLPPVPVQGSGDSRTPPIGWGLDSKGVGVGSVKVVGPSTGVVDPTPGAEDRVQPIWTFKQFAHEMNRSDITQSDLAREIGILPKAVSDWYKRKRIPMGRQGAIQSAISKIRARKKE